MTKITCNMSQLTWALLLALTIGFASCKSQKAVTDATADVMTTADEEEEEIVEEEEVIEEEPAPVERKAPKLTKEQRLDNYFGAIATASSTDAANASIEEALTMFSSPDAPVLVVIYKDGTQVGYDEPTTIENYLHYLKDTSNDNTAVEEIVYDNDGNIKELVLKK